MFKILGFLLNLIGALIILYLMYVALVIGAITLALSGAV